MRLLISILLIALLSAVACFYFPWWIISVIAFGICVLIPQSPSRSFLAGFAALFIVWGGLSWYLSVANEHILAHKISMLMFKTDSPFLLILITALIGSLVAGTAALAGSFVRERKVAVEKNA